MSCQKFICFAVRNGITKQRGPNYLINKLIVLRYRFCVNVISFTEQMYLAERWLSLENLLTKSHV